MIIRFNGKYPALALALCAGIAPFQADAGGIETLKKGFYIPPDVGCSGIGGAAGIYFDGRNISGHYQRCRTTRLIEKDSYKSVCIEAQGPNQPKIYDIGKDPDRTTVIQNIYLRSKGSFVLNNTIYNHCRT